MKYLFICEGKDGRPLITAQDKATKVEERFTDFLAFYNKDGNLIAIISKSEIIAIFTMKEVE